MGLTYLLKNIADTLWDLTKINKLSVISYVLIYVHESSEVTEENLLAYLQDYIPDVISESIKIDLFVGNTPEHTAIIKSVEGIPIED